VTRTSVVAFSEPPGVLTELRADFDLDLRSDECVEIRGSRGRRGGDPVARRFRAAAARARYAMRERRRQGARITTNGRLFNAWIDKSRADLALLTTPMRTGPYPYAGIPWFSTCFGRDGIITAWQILWFDPGLARGVLSYLAAHQATEISAFMTRARQDHARDRGRWRPWGVPFGFRRRRHHPAVGLAGAYVERTGDVPSLVGGRLLTRAAA
jgi:glycogen debranching enzyme